MRLPSLLYVVRRDDDRLVAVLGDVHQVVPDALS